MNTDDEDREWLEACIAAVDKIPAANLHHPSRVTSHHSHVLSGSSTSTTSGRTLDSGLGVSASRDSATTSHHSSMPGGFRPPNNRASRPPAAGTGRAVNSMTRPLRCIGVAQSIPYVKSKSAPAHDNFRSHATIRRFGRLQGVGAHPDEDMRMGRGHDGHCGPDDPCWRCGSPVVLKQFGSNSFFGCSSHPLCKATRKGHKNGAVIELIAEKADSSDTSDTESRSASRKSTCTPEEDDKHDGCVARCHLAVTVRGGHQDGGAAVHRAWEVLRRNGVIPGTRLAGDSGTILKAVLDLRKREFVRRVAIMENISFRDIPQTTFSRLVGSEAGAIAGTGLAHDSEGKGGKTAQTTRRLEPINLCESLMYTLPAVLRNTLLPFQREGVMYGLRRKGRFLIADEMGTGKTLQALAVMGCYKDDWPLLIVAPASMRLMWAEEVERWYPFLAPGDLHVIKGNKDKLYLPGLDRHLWPRVTIVSYFMLRMLANSIGKDDWKAVIFDESHIISTKLGNKKMQSQQVAVCMEVAARAKRVVLLSGTPSLSKPFDLFNQVEAVSPGLLGRSPAHIGKYDFASNYCQGAMRQQRSRAGALVRVPYISGCEYADELHLLLKNEVMIRRLKANVVDQLPPLRRIVVRVAEHLEHLRRAVNEGGYDDDQEGNDGVANGGTGNGNDDDNGIDSGGGRGLRVGMRAMSDDQKAGLKKVRSASEWIIDKLSASEETKTKFVVFAHHKIVLDRLQEAFEVAGIGQKGQYAGASTNSSGSASTGRASTGRDDGDGEGGDTMDGCFSCLRIDGEVPTALRAARLSEFNTKELCRVLLVSITAGGQGLDFTAASNVVFVELPESPAWLRQAEDRLHRRRQEKSVNVYMTVLPPGSHDDTRWLHLSEKLTAQSSVVNGTAGAENMDVDRVFEAGGLIDSEDHYWRSASGGANNPDVEHDALDGSIGSPSSHTSTACPADDDARDDDPSDGSDEDDTTMMESKMNVEVAAMLLTPLDLDTHRASQSPTLRLLRSIADSPSSRKSGTPAKGESGGESKFRSTGKKGKAIDDFFSSQESTRSAEQSKLKASGKVKATRRQEKYEVVRDSSSNASTKRKTKTKHAKVKARATAAGPTARHSSDSNASDADAGQQEEVLVVNKLTFELIQKSVTKEKGKETETENLPSRRKRAHAVCTVRDSVPSSSPCSSPTSKDSTDALPPLHLAGKRRPISNMSTPATWAEWERATPPPPPRRCRTSASTRASSLAFTATCIHATSTSPCAGSNNGGDGGIRSDARKVGLWPSPVALGSGDGEGGAVKGVKGCNDIGDLGTDADVPSVASNAVSSSISNTVLDQSDVERVSGSDQTLKRGIKPSSFLSPSPPPVAKLVDVVDLSMVEEENDEPSSRLKLKMKTEMLLATAGEQGQDTDDSRNNDGRIDFNGDVDSNGEDHEDDIDPPATSGRLPAGRRGNSFAAKNDDLGDDHLESDANLGGEVKATDARTLCGGFWSQMSAKRCAARAKSVGFDGQNDRRKRREEVDLASKLLFAVSFNTGRVHVYKEAEGPGPADGAADATVDLVDSGGERDEERQATHCRANFRPEDLDRLYEVARSWSSGGHAAKYQGLARQALEMLPEILHSAPALVVAREFVKEWRELPTRKRPLFKGKPCRPPLAAVARKYTPLLTGSTQRYSDRLTGGVKATAGSEWIIADATSGSAAGTWPMTSSHGKEITTACAQSDKVLCLLCNELASVQGLAVHRRDRFCSADCMEAYGSRSSSHSLRRVVSDRDGGVCSNKSCGRDCQALVSSLKAVESQQKRREILTAFDPRFEGDQYRALRERLVRAPREGFAWNADHVTAVYQGGGKCGADNLRTLCVLCHAVVTKEQAKERAATRALTRTTDDPKAPQRKQIPGQRRLVRFGGGISLSQESTRNGKASPSSPNRADGTLADEDDQDLMLSEKDRDKDMDDMGSSSDDDVVVLKSATSRTKGLTTTGKRETTPRTSTSNSRHQSQSRGEVGRTCISGGGVSKGGDSHRLQANKTGSMLPAEYGLRDYFERLVSGADLFEASPCATPSSMRRSDGSVGKDSSVDSASGALGGAGLGARDGSDGGTFSFTRVRRLKKPTERSVASSGAARASCFALENRSSSDSDGSGSA